jgi:hypothetical protein
MRSCLRFVSEGTLRRNGARIPSIAEEVATDLVTDFSLSSGLRRYRFAKESFAPTHLVYSRLEGKTPR